MWTRLSWFWICAAPIGILLLCASVVSHQHLAEPQALGWNESIQQHRLYLFKGSFGYRLDKSPPGRPFLEPNGISAEISDRWYTGAVSVTYKVRNDYFGFGRLREEG